MREASERPGADVPEPSRDIPRAIAILQAFPSESNAPFGDRESWALGVLYRCYRRMVAAVVAPVLPSSADVDDAVEDVFVKLPRSLRQYRDGNFEAWLKTVAVRVALTRLRTDRRRREEPLPAELEGSGPAVDATDSARLADRDAVGAALAKLPDGLRVVVVLRAYDYSNGEIAELLGITPDAVAVRYHRAVLRLRSMLRGSDG